MGKVSFIHLSDIHFVKTSGNPGDIDKDLRDAIITDININAKKYLGDISGVLVSGDIAFSGHTKEYEKAQDFLKEITDIFNISTSSVYCVPGNHDVDQSVPKSSLSVYEAQCKLDNIEKIDELDKAFERSINDSCYNDILFKTTEEYNNFASMFGCNIHAEKINWEHCFKLDNNMILKIHGINSCFISNADDHKCQNDNRLMYIGQAQIPKREQNAVVLSLCHHPPEYWKFKPIIQEKMNKRADLQLYGHKHNQSIVLTDENIVITSGATHPIRGDGWNPRYNWITIECKVISNKRVINVNIYPRILDKCRDKFCIDTEFCKDKNYIEHTLHIDLKREKDLKDKFPSKSITSLCCENKQSDKEEEIILRDLVYKFFDLTYIRQTEILIELDLLDDEDKNKRYSIIISKILDKAQKTNKMKELWSKVNI